MLDTETELQVEVPAKTTEQIIGQLAGLLPSQGPITAFAFLNPLQALEGEPFMEAMAKAADLFGVEPFLAADQYRSMLSTGRITRDDLAEILTEEAAADANYKLAGLVRDRDLRMSMLEHSINPGTEEELKWVIAQSDALTRFHQAVPHHAREGLVDATRQWVMSCQASGARGTHGSHTWSWLVENVVAEHDSALRLASDDSAWEAVSLALIWEIARTRMFHTPNGLHKSPVAVRHRDLLLAVTSEDSDVLVHEVLVPFCAAFLDQGYAHWRLPEREQGFFKSFLNLMGCGGHMSRYWLQGLRSEARRLLEQQRTPLESIEESLSELGIGAEEKEAFLLKSLLSLRGYAGMLWQTETRPDRVFIPSPAGTLLEYLAAQLLLERFALLETAKQSMGYTGDLDQLRKVLQAELPEHQAGVSVEQRAYPILILAQLHGWTPKQLAGLSDEQWIELVHAEEKFSEFQRRRVFHLAYERHLTRGALDAFAARAALPLVRPAQPKLQVITCIDAREESFRRYLEEVDPEVETFAHAGFYCVPIYFRGVAEAHFAALCPVIMKPQHWITEEVVLPLAESHRQRAGARRLAGTLQHQFNTGTRGSIMGTVLTGLLGPLFTIPLVGRILFPRLTAKIHRTTRRMVAPPPITRLRLERTEGIEPGPVGEGIGFTLSEMINMAERVLRDIGMTESFAPLVTFLGHGSNCLNNPHESAYHCGACSGSSGSPNARALALMLNDRRVRMALAERGLAIPDQTYFLGGLHNTATGAVSFYDIELMPTMHLTRFKEAMSIFEKVALRDAQERCRRFQTAPLDLSPEEALRHVEDRSDDLSQTRPEYGNGTNAFCFVGRRERIRGMYLDRRSFLMSYNAAQDNEESMILARILAAVIPVCEAINLLYTFSRIDNRGWGSGTKLPHNVTSLLGVMDGAASDLRPGLPWQSVDIHEPVRLLFVIEASAEAMLKIMRDNDWVDRICRNDWAQLAVLDYHSNRLQRFVNGKFVDYQPLLGKVPTIASCMSYYRGQRGDLPFAILESVLKH